MGKRKRRPTTAPWTPATVLTDTPPLRRVWQDAEINWQTREVRDDWGEYKHGTWRVLLLFRDRVTQLWPPSSPVGVIAADADSTGNVVGFNSRKRGRQAKATPRVMDSMRQDLRESKFTIQELADMTEEALRAQYQASRDTCRKARDRILAESGIVDNSRNGISDK
jgi:hypothetical protein